MTEDEPPPPQEAPPEEGSVIAPVTTAPAEAPVTVVSTQVRVISAEAEAHCRAVAQQRKDDASAYDYDDDTVERIYDGTLKNCMKWETDHPQ